MSEEDEIEQGVNLPPEMLEWAARRPDSASEVVPPPWLLRPDLPMSSMGWRMGPGEDLKMEFFEYYKSLGSEQRDLYRSEYSEPATWRGYYDAVERAIQAQTD